MTDDELRAAYEGGATLRELGRALGLDRTTVRRRLDAAGLPRRPRSRARDVAELAAAYAAGATLEQLAAERGVSAVTVGRWIATSGRSARLTGRRGKRLAEDVVDAIVTAYASGVPVAGIAAANQVSTTAVLAHARAAGLPHRETRTRPTSELTASLVARYRAGTSLRQLAKVYGLGVYVVRRELVEAGVPIRGRRRVRSRS